MTQLCSKTLPEVSSPNRFACVSSAIKFTLTDGICVSAVPCPNSSTSSRLRGRQSCRRVLIFANSCELAGTLFSGDGKELEPTSTETTGDPSMPSRCWALRKGSARETSFGCVLVPYGDVRTAFTLPADSGCLTFVARSRAPAYGEREPRSFVRDLFKPWDCPGLDPSRGVEVIGIDRGGEEEVAEEGGEPGELPVLKMAAPRDLSALYICAFRRRRSSSPNMMPISTTINGKRCAAQAARER